MDNTLFKCWLLVMCLGAASTATSKGLAQQPAPKPPTPPAPTTDCSEVRQQVAAAVTKLRIAPSMAAIEATEQLALARRQEILTGAPATASGPATSPKPECLTHAAGESDEARAEINGISRDAIEGAARYSRARLLDIRACDKSKEVIARTKNGQFQSARSLLACEFQSRQKCVDEDGKQIVVDGPTIVDELRTLKAVSEASADSTFSIKLSKIEKCVTDAETELEKRETEFFESTPCGLDDSPDRETPIRKKPLCFVLGVIPATLSFVRVERLDNYRGSASTELLSVAVPYAGLRWNPFRRLRVLSFEGVFYSAYLTSTGVRNAVSGSSKSCSTSGSTFETSLGCQGDASVAPYIGAALSISVGERSLGYVSWFPITGGLARVGTDSFRSAFYWGTLIGIVSLNRTF